MPIPRRYALIPLACSLAVVTAPTSAAADRSWSESLTPSSNLVREGSRWVFSLGVPAWDIENEEELLGDDGFDLAFDLTAAYWPGADMITDHAGAHFGLATNLRVLHSESDSGSSSFESTRYDLSLRYLLGLHWAFGKRTGMHLTAHLGAGMSYLTSESSGPGFANSDADFNDGFVEYGATLGMLFRAGEDAAVHVGVEYSAHYENHPLVDIEYHWLVPKAGVHLRF